MKAPARPVTLMLWAQIACTLTIPLTICAFLPVIRTAEPLCILRDMALCGCLAYAEFEGVRLCGRMRRASAFSARNIAGLGRIMASLGTGGCISLICGDPLIPLLLTGLPDISPIVMHLLMPFTLLTLSLMLRAVQVLMRRAVDMQMESDLTV